MKEHGNQSEPVRADLSREPWAFVPDPLALDGLMIHTTSGTTGHRVVVPSHPIVNSSYVPLLRRALALRGVTLQSHRAQVACVLVGYQRQCFTYASVTPEMDEAGYVKINLHPDDWRDPADRAKFLDACNPEIYTGDPISFVELAQLPLQTRPQALISTAMRLLPGVRRLLEERFACPVLDLYSLNEAGPIGVAFDDHGHLVLQHRLYVEILDAHGTVCPLGERGEITLSGGFNFYLPLLRYRTGDHASLTFRGTQPFIVGLEGRPPTIFRDTRGQTINNIDVTHALKPFALPQFALHQAADGALTMRVRGTFADQAKLCAALLALFGAAQPLTIEEVESFGDGKVIQYTSET
ncbi:MAG: capsule biosynthesis protein CapK [Chloroflexota bacterium]